MKKFSLLAAATLAALGLCSPSAVWSAEFSTPPAWTGLQWSFGEGNALRWTTGYLSRSEDQRVTGLVSYQFNAGQSQHKGWYIGDRSLSAGQRLGALDGGEITLIVVGAVATAAGLIYYIADGFGDTVRDLDESAEESAGANGNGGNNNGEEDDGGVLPL